MKFFELAGFAILFFILIYIGYIIGKYFGKKQFEDQIPELREDAIKQSRAVLSGQLNEQIAPYMPDFPYKATEARFIGKPVDFVVFKGMDSKKIDEVVFVEVKSGKSSLSDVEKSLKNAVENKRIGWFEYKIKNVK